MRQWHLPPELMCQQHLLGEHVEHHMFVGALIKGTHLYGYVKDRLLIPTTLQYRHECIVKEMLRRGYNHKSPLPMIHPNALWSFDDLLVSWDLTHNLADIVNRCPKCAKLVDQAIYDRRLDELLIPWQEFVARAINDRSIQKTA